MHAACKWFFELQLLTLTFLLYAGHSCPESWRYPFECPQDSKANSNQTNACCYDNGPSCCKPGGRRCTDKGADERDYCPRPKDDGKLKYCCEQNGKPSCCASSGVCLNFRWVSWLGKRKRKTSCVGKIAPLLIGSIVFLVSCFIF